jgi:pyrroline-5-carboxylate reductase
MALKNKRLGIIGGGNMAQALLGGICSDQKNKPRKIFIAEPQPVLRRKLKKTFPVVVSPSNVEVVKRADLIVLAVKPQVLTTVLREIAPCIRDSHLIISIAAGVDSKLIQNILGEKARIVRAMPNTPALIKEGMTGVYASRRIKKADRQLVQDFFSSVGEVLFVNKEDDLDWVTALSGSGPAYVYYFLESMIKAGEKGGLKTKDARQLSLACLRGAVGLASIADEDLAALRKKVTSKGGTTEAALKSLALDRWPQALQRAIRQAAARAKNLRKEQKKSCSS